MTLTSPLLQACVLALLIACGGAGDGSKADSPAESGKHATTMVSNPLRAVTVAGAPTTAAPQVLYTDALSGPTSGGENNNGAYLSVFGRNFGAPSDLGKNTKVYIGTTEVANYRYLGNAKSSSKTGLQQITVQVGSLGGATKGAVLPVKVVVGGVSSNTDNTFTPSAGRVLFVSLSGSDTTAVPNDITKPWRSLQNMSTLKGAYFAMQSGDHIVIRGGSWSDASGQDTTWMRFGAGTYARNGNKAAWIHITAYPGPVNGNSIEDVHYTTPAAKSGGIAGPWQAIAGTSGNYISISNLRMDVAGGANRDAAPVNFQYTAGPWRVVNNELGPWVVGSSTILNAAGVSGHGNGNQILGNNIHDIAGTSELQNHGIYADTTAQGWEVAYNWIHNITGGSAVQFNDNEAGAGSYVLPDGSIWPGFVGIRIHHNWLENAAKYGINFNAQGSAPSGTYEARSWNNVIVGTQLYPLRINATAPTQNMWFAYNTIYDAMTGPSAYSTYVMDEGIGSAAGIHNTFYHNTFVFGPHTQAGTTWLIDYSTPSTATSYDFKQNLYFTNGQNPVAPGTLGDTLALVGNPLFKNPAAADYSLQSTSPAVDAATQADLFAVNDDFQNTARPQGKSKDIGAFEFSGSVPVNPGPVNGICGTSNGKSFSVAPTANLCASGTVSGFTGSGPWVWSCMGSNGGTSTSCSAGVAPPPVVSGPPSLVQQYSGAFTGGTTTHRFGGNVTAGDWILITVGVNNNALAVSGTMADNQGRTSIAAFGTPLGHIYVDGMGTDVYAVKATATGAYALTLGIANLGTVHMMEIANADPASLLDAPLVTSSGPRFATAVQSSPTQQTSKANDLVLALVDLGMGSAIPFTQSGLWTIASPEAGTTVTSRVYQWLPGTAGAFAIGGTVAGTGAGYPGWESVTLVIKGM